MKSGFKILVIILFPCLLNAQEPGTQYHLQNALNKRSALIENQLNPKTKRFDLLTNKLNNQHAATTLALKQKLDSISRTFVNDPSLRNKEYITYNNAGKETSHVYTEWSDSAKMYLNVLKIETVYDLTGNFTGSYVYNGNGLNWINSTKSELSYNAYNKLITTINYAWNSSKTLWEFLFKSELIYDMNGFATQALGFEWNTANNQWTNTEKTELEYDSNGNLLNQTLFAWNNQWLFLAHDEFTYNNSNQELSYVSQYWDDITGDWINEFKSTNQYNTQLYIINYTKYNWDQGSGQWSASDQTDYGYDAPGNMTTSISSNWDVQSNKWVPYYKEECTYKNQFVYDDLILTLNTGYENEIYFHHMLTKITSYVYDAGTYRNDETIDFFYSGINITKTIDHSIENIQICPNPAHNYFRVISNDQASIMNFTLLDISGKPILSKKINSNESFASENLTPGFYTYRIISENKTVQTGKLIID